jgi:glycosyltransferase involved in cell wall biosynthesis
MRVAFWGTYDLGKPRNRILLRSLQENGVEVLECHRPIWEGVEDKSRLTLGRRLRFLLRWLAAYPALVLAYLRLPRHDVVLVGYLGQLDVLVLWPFARLRRVPVVWDAFLSLHDTVVDDRALVSPRHPLARLLYAWEWLAARAADRVLLDTRAHAEAFARTFGLPAERVGSVLVGAEPEAFPATTGAPVVGGPSPPRSPSPTRTPFRPGEGEVGEDRAEEQAVRVLFYGQLIPLHGVETIVRAARLARGEAFEWVLIGQGQEEEKVRRMLEEEPLPRLRWVPWVPYGELARWIGEADVCLGIFGASGKAARVIPNKVFQVLSAGKPLVTRDSPAIRELLDAESPGIYLVPPADPEALLEALHRFRAERATLAGRALHTEIRERITPRAIGRDLLALLAEVAGAA